MGLRSVCSFYPRLRLLDDQLIKRNVVFFRGERFGDQVMKWKGLVTQKEYFLQGLVGTGMFYVISAGVQAFSMLIHRENSSLLKFVSPGACIFQSEQTVHQLMFEMLSLFPLPVAKLDAAGAPYPRTNAARVAFSLGGCWNPTAAHPGAQHDLPLPNPAPTDLVPQRRLHRHQHGDQHAWTVGPPENRSAHPACGGGGENRQVDG